MAGPERPDGVEARRLFISCQAFSCTSLDNRGQKGDHATMENDDLHLLPVRAVVSRTGVPAHLLRAWERRYGAVEPHRSPGGHRLYSEAEVERIRLLRDAVARGETISSVARLPTDTLRRIAGTPPSEPSPSRGGESEAVPESRFLEAMAAVEDRNGDRLREILQGASFRLTHLAFLEEFVSPLLRRIGDAWSRSVIGVVEEHLASQVIRSVLTEMLRASAPPAGSPVILCAAPAGQRHEFGALLAAVTSSQAGWKAIYLGPDLPRGEIIRLASSSGARAVAVGVLHPSSNGGRDDASSILEEIEELRDALPSATELFVGGHPDAREAAGRVQGVVPLATLADLDRILRASPAGKGAEG
jgi:MerR family transcriptional regulator, light-induced transcriptional regulator